MINSDSVPMDTTYTGPMPEYDSSTKRYKPTKEFVEGMIQMFKDGGKLPKRIVFEIVLGCKEILDQESSLVEVDIGKGVKCDIVGDTHGVSQLFTLLGFALGNMRYIPTAILRPVQPIDDAYPAI